MRPFVYRLARALGLGGRVRNDGQGVTVEAFGEGPALRRFLERLRAEKPPAARFDDIACEPIPPEPAGAFAIVESEAPAEGPLVSIPADLAPCPECLRELSDPADRRFRYPFTNCTRCGPRFTIARGVPYDRARTTMAPFTLCPDCRREYEDPADRRFHAEPNACPACGPRLALLSPGGEELALREGALRAAAGALARGLVVAVKGVGGYHLACDAGSGPAVSRLRARKHREEKPLAVMPRDLEEAERLAVLTAPERALLTSVERPIVLVRGREGSGLCREVAPGTPLLGLVLPYSPLHHLLLAEAGRPLVMTSGNLSEEPIAFEDREARERLRAIADLFLVHDRQIEAGADDSVARLLGGLPVLLRRSRGYVPEPLRPGRPFSLPILACGAQKKSSFCLGLGDLAYLGPHVGDLENLATLEAFEGAVARFERLLRKKPLVLAHDLHPDYASTRYARERARAESLLAVGVQHHHAHAASAMAEHGLEGPVLALTWDGTGLGEDGTAWGGELLLARYQGYERLATFRPLRLAGGDQAIREPWRVALAALLDAFEGDPPLPALALFEKLRAGEVSAVRQLIAEGFRAPLAHGAGRAFDAVAALARVRPWSRYEGQPAVLLEAAVDLAEEGAYPFAVDVRTTPWQLDLRPLYRAVAADLGLGRSPGTVAARFHRALVQGGAELVRLAVARLGPLPLVLSGGCFANAVLGEGLSAELSPRVQVYLHRRVPPGDGGLALGQALVADAKVRAAKA